MTPIRPAAPQPTPAVQPRSAEAARTAAQKAFFELAMGRAAAPAAVSAPTAQAPAPAAAAPQTVAASPSAAPARPMRPGSLLDIRV